MGTIKLRGLLVFCLAGLILGGCASNEPEYSGPGPGSEPTEQIYGASDMMDDASSDMMDDASSDMMDDTSSDMMMDDASSDMMMDDPSSDLEIPSVANGKVSVPADDGMGPKELLNGFFYFDFDQAIVKRAGHSELDTHARVLVCDRDQRMRLEGHADERGTREYNLALAERRANAVRAYLVAQGVARSQIEVISYGEEKPANSGHSESAWAQNRRVEIIYR